MYVKVGDLVATSDNVVLKIKKWPSTIRGVKGLGGLIVPDSVNQYDNGRELYLGEVVNSDNDFYKAGDDVAVDIYFGSHVPSEEKSVKIKIVPATGIVLKSEKPLEVMGDITKMEPGINRIYLKLRKKESVTAAGIIIPDTVVSQDPTAQDVRMGDIVKSSDDRFKKGDVVLIEAFAGKNVYLDPEKNLFVVCYATDILAKVDINKK